MRITLVWYIHAITQQVSQNKKTNGIGSPAIDLVMTQVIQDLQQMTLLIAAGSIA